MLAGRLPGAGQELMDRLREFDHIAMWVQACRAESVGEVQRAAGAADPWCATRSRPRRHGAVPRRDVHGGAHARRRRRARAVLPGIHGLPYRLLPDEIDRIKDASLDPRAYLAILSHLFGGCVMGKDPARSVCDGRGRVHGYGGLVVADASVIPTNLGVNPQHTIKGFSRGSRPKSLAGGVEVRSVMARGARN